MTSGQPVYVAGLDLGQSQDFTALSILEKTWQPDPDKPEEQVAHYGVRHLKRWQLGTRYTAIIDEVGELVEKPPLCWPLVGIDQTGVGKAVVEMFRTAGMKATIRPVLITAGHQITPGDDGSIHVPKKELASCLQVLLQSRRLKVADGEHRETLVKELLAFKVMVTAAANETFEAWRERDHDDLVLSVAIAAWLAERGLGTPFVPPPVVGEPTARSGETMYGRRRGDPSEARNQSVLDYYSWERDYRRHRTRFSGGSPPRTRTRFNFGRGPRPGEGEPPNYGGGVGGRCPTPIGQPPQCPPPFCMAGCTLDGPRPQNPVMFTPPSHLSTGQVAAYFGLPPWMVARLFERHLLDEPPRLARQRMIPVADLPRIEQALKQAGYLPRQRRPPPHERCPQRPTRRPPRRARRPGGRDCRPAAGDRSQGRGAASPGGLPRCPREDHSPGASRVCRPAKCRRPPRHSA
jgi:hypothetical protein